jgi:NAD(P)H-flavin reductase
MQINELKIISKRGEKMCSYISKFKPGKTEFCGPGSY